MGKKSAIQKGKGAGSTSKLSSKVSSKLQNKANSTKESPIELNMGDLKDMDPDFFKFLQQEDPALLKFKDLPQIPNESANESASEEDVYYAPRVSLAPPSAGGGADSDSFVDYDSEDMSESGEELEEELDRVETTQVGQRTGHARRAELDSFLNRGVEEKISPITRELVKKWESDLFDAKTDSTSTLVSLKTVLVAYKALAHLFSPSNVEASTMFMVEPGNGFNTLFNLCINTLPYKFNDLFEFDPEEINDVMGDFKPYTNESFTQERNEMVKILLPRFNIENWPRIRNLVFCWVNFSMAILDASNVDFNRMILKAIEHIVPYLLCLPTLVKKLYPILFEIWASSDEKNRIISFLILRKLCVLGGELHLNHILKSAYLVYVKSTKMYNKSTAAQHRFMENCLVELFSFDNMTSYQYIFVYTRQLAYTLRLALDTSNKHALNTVYNWRFLCSLFMLARLVCTGVSQSDKATKETYEQLVFPVSQIINGSLNLSTSPSYFPARLHLITALNQLVKATGTFSPIVHHLTVITKSPSVISKPKDNALHTSAFEFAYKIGKTELGTDSYQTQCSDMLQYILLTHINTFADSLSFPELALPILVQLKRAHTIAKNNKNLSSGLKQIEDKIKENITFIRDRRNKKLIGIHIDEKKEIAPLRDYMSRWEDITQGPKKQCKDQTNTDIANSIKLDEEALEKERKQLLNLKFRDPNAMFKAKNNIKENKKESSKQDSEMDDGDGSHVEEGGDKSSDSEFNEDDYLSEIDSNDSDNNDMDDMGLDSHHLNGPNDIIEDYVLSDSD